ncbi:transcription initiation factor TFIID subunit 4 [Colossoma macropomum]|uniref:transcription initiation factor TFIID subunit 4 n=1 Tax=Colossoma macropomum TaxID=42526 RepID=UPI001864E622|nr:transcription initiation factor TFIID subunit 4 [Colossoma macropomum]
MSKNETANNFSIVQDESEVSSNEAAAAGAKAAKPQTSQVSGERSVGSECTANVTNASHTSTKASALPGENKNPSSEPREALKKEPAKADLLSMPSSMLSKSAVAVAPVSSTVSSSSLPSAPKIIVSTAAVRSSAPLVVGARVLPSATAPAVTSLQGLGALAAHPGGTPNQTGGPAMTPAPVQGAIMAFPRTSTPQQTVPVARGPQTTSIQLPANFHIPQGMVLIRSDSGQLMLVSQQALAQVQAQGLVPRQPGVTTTVRPQSSQATATATSIIRVSIPPSPANVATIINPAPSTGTAVLKPTSTPGTTIIKATSMPGSTIIKPTTVLGTTGLKPSSTTGTTVIKATASQKLPSNTSSGSINQSTMSGTTVISTSVVKSIGKASLSPSVTQIIRPGGSAPRNISPNIPTRHSTTKSCAPIPVTAETLENVKKCKNFLVTLMKLASSGTRSANMAQNVRALVKDLLDGQLEAEEFTEKLYMELKSSPQPYLVPFLKRSLPAVRQLTPNSQLFIQQCDQPKPLSSSSGLGNTSQKHNVTSSNSSQPLRGSLPVRPSQLVIQQSKGVTVRHPVTTSSCGDAPVQKPKQLIIQTNTQPGGALGMQYSLQGSKAPSTVPPPAMRMHSFKDSTSGSFRDDDDINDVASMAGVNVNEENARILASSAELVGSVVHSCRDEPFLQTPALQQRVQHIGSSLGVIEASPDVLGLLSHATQERLRGLLEKLTAIAQHRSISYRNDWRHIQTNDTRSQLKFLEQLEKVEKRRREEEERETLLRIAKTRSSSEDPEQLRLKQRAKEMQQLELAQMQHREANLAALAALGPRKRKPLEASGPGANQVLASYAQRTGQRVPTRVTFRDLIFCMEQDLTLRHSLVLYNAFLR